MRPFTAKALPIVTLSKFENTAFETKVFFILAFGSWYARPTPLCKAGYCWFIKEIMKLKKIYFHHWNNLIISFYIPKWFSISKVITLSLDSFSNIVFVIFCTLLKFGLHFVLNCTVTNSYSWCSDIKSYQINKSMNIWSFPLQRYLFQLEI